MSFHIDDVNLVRLWKEMSPRQRAEAMRNGFRREAAKVRRVLVEQIKSSGIHNAAKLARCARSAVYKRTAGFRVTVGESRGRGYYTNSRGKEKPVLRWADTGTDYRFTKKTSAGRGKMPRYGFIEKTEEKVRYTVPEDIKNEFILNTLKTARKYGCY